MAICPTQFQNKSHSWNCTFASKQTSGPTSNSRAFEKRHCLFLKIKIFSEMARISPNALNLIYSLNSE
jgi:hypothetical protein